MSVSQPVVQTMTMFVVILVLYEQVISRPCRFESNILNEVESTSVLVSLPTFGLNVLFSDERVTSAVQYFETLGVAFCSLALLICFLFFLLPRTSPSSRSERGDRLTRWTMYIIKVYVSTYIFTGVKKRFSSLFSFCGNLRRAHLFKTRTKAVQDHIFHAELHSELFNTNSMNNK